MKVTQEKLPASQVGLEIEIPPERSKQAYEKVVQDLARSAHIPGFRKGKAPRHVLIQSYGVERVKATAIEKLLQEGIEKAIEQEQVQAINTFDLRSDFDDLIRQFKPGEAFTFSGVVDVQPEITLRDYQNLTVQVERVLYDPKQVEDVLEDYRHQLADLLPVEERPAQENDVVTIDYDGYLIPEDETEGSEGDRQPLPGGSAEDAQVELREGQFISDFIQGIVGMTVGETREISVCFPDDYISPDLAGQTARFTITLKDIKQKDLPELDDGFAQQVSNFETLTALRDSLEKRYRREAEEATAQNKETAILIALAEQAEVDPPETLIRQESDYLIRKTAIQLQNQGLDINKILTQEMIPKLREEVRSSALIQLKQTLALREVGLRESLRVSPEEVDVEVEKILREVGEQITDGEDLRLTVEDNLQRAKVFRWLEDHAHIEWHPSDVSEETELDSAPAGEGTPSESAVDGEKTPDIPESSDEPAVILIDTFSEVPEKSPESDPNAESTLSSEPTES